MRLQPDDDVYRINAVWLGPRGLTLPWVARYTAYAIWLAAFVTILLFEVVTPLPVGVPPMWEFAISVLATYAVMGFVDHERPLRAVLEVARAEVTGPRGTSAPATCACSPPASACGPGAPTSRGSFRNRERSQQTRRRSLPAGPRGSVGNVTVPPPSSWRCARSTTT